MADKDIVSKDILKRIAVDIARVLLHLRVERAEIIETEYQRIEDRRADLVARMWGEEGDFILHIEIQNSNDCHMPVRMLRYRSDIMRVQAKLDIRQYLIYIGKEPLSMAEGIQQTGLDYRYPIIDMHKVDCRELLIQDNPDALVLAILCDFKGRPEREVVHYILQRLHQLTATNESQFREYMRMLSILSTNRALGNIIEEEEKMLSQVEVTRLPFYNLGLEAGMQQGIERGVQQGMQQGVQQGMQQEARNLLQRQLTRRFGTLGPAESERLKTATLHQLEQWADNILDAVTLEDVFRISEPGD